MQLISNPSFRSSRFLRLVYLVEMLLAIVTRNSRAHMDCDMDESSSSMPKSNTILKHNTAFPNGIIIEPIGRLKAGGKLAVKCGIIPAQLISNNRSHARFYMNWNFESDSLLKVSFRVDFVEDYANLKYYYAIRKYTGLEVYSQVLNLENTSGEQSNRTAEESVKRRLRRGDDDGDDDANETTTNRTKHMILDFKDLPKPSLSNRNYYEMANSMLIICVMIANLNEGFSFNLPFMCADIFLDKNYYNFLINSASSSNSYAKRVHAILIALAPFLFLLILFISTVYFARKKCEYSTYFRQKLNSATNHLTRHDLKPSNIFKLLRKERSPNRYDMNNLERNQVMSVERATTRGDDKKKDEMIGNNKKFPYPIFQGTITKSLSVDPQYLADPQLIERRSRLNSNSLVRRRFDTIRTSSSSLTIPRFTSGSVDSIDKLRASSALSFRRQSFRPVKRLPAIPNRRNVPASRTLPNDYKLRKLDDYFENSFKPIQRTSTTTSARSSTSRRPCVVEYVYRGPRSRRRVTDDGNESYEESYV